MTVDKAIQQLEKIKRINPNADLRMHHKDGEPVLFVVALANDASVAWLECESDNDMGAEISARFENKEEKQISDMDFYTDMLETGIDVEMVRKYMGDEYADKMLEFLKSTQVQNHLHKG